MPTTSNTPQNAWVITGPTSGIGRRAALELARRGTVVLQTLRTATTTQYAGGAGGTMQLDENSLVTVTPNRDGTSTILFVGRGAIWGTDASVGGSFFQWVTGVVLMRGSYDLKTGVFLVSSKTILGQVTDMCDALATGLKPRH